MIRVADYIVKRLEEEGVGHIFYVPGGQCVYLTDAIRRNENVTGIATHHEQAAAMAALSYAKYKEDIGACFVTTGCGGTNTITGVLHAWQDNVPCVFVSGQQNVNETTYCSPVPLRQLGVQEANIVKLVEPITKYAEMVVDAAKIAYIVDKAIYMAKSGRKGPTWIDVPLNIQNAMVNEDKLERFEATENKKKATEADIRFLIEAVNNAKRPIILAGHGIRNAKAEKEFEEFVNKHSIPVTFTRYGIDMLPYSNENNMGVVSVTGANRYANFAVQNADLVISIGCRLSIDTLGSNLKDFAREATKIVIDIDEVEHSKDGVVIDKLILSDARELLQSIKEIEDNGLVINEPDKLWLDKCKHWKEIFPDCSVDKTEDKPINFKFFMNSLSKQLPNGAVIVSDAGNTGIESPANCHVEAGQRFIPSFAQGEMGFAVPGAEGAACASNAMVFALSGDGSFMMNIQELQTLVRNQFNIKIIINNNNGYSGVRHGQKAHFRGKSIGVDSTSGVDFPDFGKVAAAFGMKYFKIEKYEEIDAKIKQMISENGPCICDVITDPEEFALHTALVTYGKRKFGFRPIEDQSPFIDRETFFEEMIVEPMETSYGTPV